MDNKLIVNQNSEGMRLDSFLSNNINEKSRSYLQKMIEDGRCKVNDKLVKSSYKVHYNDIIEYSYLEEKDLSLEKTDLNLNIIYQDRDVVVINKPRGLVVHPSNGHYDGNTLVNGLLYQIKDLSSINGIIRPGIVHRIDKNTSGLLVIAKNDQAHIFLQNQLKDHTMHREYYALVEGVIAHTDLKIDAPIGRDKKDRLKRSVDIYNGKEAITFVHVEERFNNYTLISCRLKTGRTHQIRVHMKYINHPIVGDPEYGRHNKHISCNGQLLHAYKLSFIHPSTHKEMSFTCPIDQEFQSIIDQLRKEK